MTASPRSGENHEHWSSCRSKTPLKWLLVMCWLTVVVHVWLAPDHDDIDEFSDHPSFGVPEREERKTLSSRDQHEVLGDIEILVDKETDEFIEFIKGIGGEGRKSTNFSPDAKDSVSVEQIQPAKKSLDSIQKSYLTEEPNSGEVKSTDPNGSGEISNDAVSKNVSEDAKNSDRATIISDDTETDAPINETKADKLSETLVEALQPTTFKQCCIPAFTNEKREDVACFGTCYNERACSDPLYPFKSVEEKAMFPSVRLTSTIRKKLKDECKSPKKMIPPVTWCQTPHADNKNGTLARLVRGIPPAGCSQVTHGGGSGPFQHVILFPAAKLAFCGIPKVGITQWEQFLRFYIGAKDYPALPHYKLDRTLFQFDQLDPKAQRRIWEDEDWTWAAFIRDPAERLLSAYLDKIRSKMGKFKWIDSTLTFEKFIDSLFTQENSTTCKDGRGAISGLSWCSDPHWRPQVYSCGISERLDRFQFIGDIHNAAEQTRELLDHVGLWDSHGKHFINGGVQVGRSPWCNIISHPHNHTHHVGFQQKDEVTNSSAAKVAYGHSKGSKGKMEKFYTPELLRKAEELYADDQNLWKLVNANGIRMSKGKELASGLSKKCSSYVLTRPLP